MARTRVGRAQRLDLLRSANRCPVTTRYFMSAQSSGTPGQGTHGGVVCGAWRIYIMGKFGCKAWMKNKLLKISGAPRRHQRVSVSFVTTILPLMT